jgi:hypothetical protein
MPTNAGRFMFLRGLVQVLRPCPPSRCCCRSDSVSLLPVLDPMTGTTRAASDPGVSPASAVEKTVVCHGRGLVYGNVPPKPGSVGPPERNERYRAGKVSSASRILMTFAHRSSWSRFPDARQWRCWATRPRRGWRLPVRPSIASASLTQQIARHMSNRFARRSLNNERRSGALYQRTVVNDNKPGMGSASPRSATAPPRLDLACARCTLRPHYIGPQSNSTIVTVSCGLLRRRLRALSAAESTESRAAAAEFSYQRVWSRSEITTVQ